MISENIYQVRNRINKACERAGRSPNEVKLLAISKTFGPDAVRAANTSGQIAFGENYIQEAVEKISLLSDLPLEWHCTGPIQSNKTSLVASHFNWIHSLDRLKIAQRLSEQRPKNLSPLNVCIQVNLDDSTTKAGVQPHQALELAMKISALPNLRLRGIMSIPAQTSDFEAALQVHMQAKVLFDNLNAAGLNLDTLSMGMTGDLDAAITAGSTMVRVGTAIFGSRKIPLDLQTNATQ